MTTTADLVFEALRTIPEPCSIAMGAPESLASMGLVESIDIVGDRVDVSLVLTDPSCVHFLSMRRYIVDTVGALDGVAEVTVRMSTTRLWTADRMNPHTPPGAPVSSDRPVLPMAR